MAPFSNLSSLQRDFLAAFFEVTDQFFLTGGAALVGAHGLPRSTKDLDLFTLHPEGFQMVNEFAHTAAEKVGAELQALQTFTTFRRYLLSRNDESIEVLDPLDEIFANKICTLVGRSEVRDLWDVYHLMRRGQDLLEGIRHANMKDGGVHLESVLLVLSSLNWAALKKAAERAGYDDWHNIEHFYSALKEDLAMQILPPKS